MALLLWFITICGCVSVTAPVPPSVGLHCNVSHSQSQTTFSIQDRPEFTDDGCEYSWCNETGNVIANQAGGIPGLVLSHSVRSLVTSGCQDAAHYEVRCGPKWEKLVAQCSFTCAKTPARPEATPGQRNVAALVSAPYGLVLCCFLVLLVQALKKFNIERC